jgi:hypothetical protein
MDIFIMAAVIINFVALIPLVAVMQAHSLHSWTHSMRGFTAMVPMTFYVTEAWFLSANSTSPDSFAYLCMTILLVVSVVVTIKFSLEAFIIPRLTPWSRRYASRQRSKAFNVNRLGLHLLSK